MAAPNPPSLTEIEGWLKVLVHEEGEPLSQTRERNTSEAIASLARAVMIDLRRIADAMDRLANDVFN